MNLNGMAIFVLSSVLLWTNLGSVAGAVQTAPPDVVIMIHGAGGGGCEYDLWKPVFERAGWKVIARDLQPVEKGLEATTFADYVAQVKQWIPSRRRRLALVGASLGGILALKVAETVSPDALILINSAPPAGVGKPRRVTKYPPVIRWANGPIQDTRDALPDGDEATVQWAHPQWRDESGTVLNMVRQGVAARKPVVPTLVIIGENDTDIAPELSLALARWANADVHQYARTSHIGPLFGKRAEEIATAAERWLRARIPARQ
jgi:pimeloyl-ACP methyl ester carboxylesterase